MASHLGLGAERASLIEVDVLNPTSRYRLDPAAEDGQTTAYLQYTSGSTREPAGVMMSHGNVLANFEQLMGGYFADRGRLPPPDTTILSWLPFYHDMGLLLGVCAPVILGLNTVLTSPVAFLQRPARWMQLMASHGHVYTAGPNFAFEVASRKTTDDDMAGLDLADVLTIVTGSERVHPATLRRFAQRFARFNLSESAIRPSYGLAEATVYVATRAPGGTAEGGALRRRQAIPTGTRSPLRVVGARRWSAMARRRRPRCGSWIPRPATECPAGTTGEIWVHGDNVAVGYWGQPERSEETFGATLLGVADGTPEARWLRTGDLGFISDGELFIVGRIKDLLIVYGRNHSPDDIEATILEISGGRVAAISVADGHTEKLVAIIEQKKRGASDDEVAQAARHHSARRRVGGVRRARPRHRGPGLGVPGGDPDNDQRQGQAIVVCRVLPARPIRSLGTVKVPTMGAR